MTHHFNQLPIDQALSEHPCTCIDGRTEGERFSVAGGSFALLAEALNALQAMTRQSLSEQEAAELLTLFAENAGLVYLHSDEHAMQRVFARLGLAPDTDLRALTPQQQKSFVELATRPEFQGCGHLKLMLEQPDLYGVSTKLVQRLLQAFYRHWFAGADRLQFEVLKGEHAEQAVVIDDAPRNNRHIVLFRSDEPAFYVNYSARFHLVCRFAMALQASGRLQATETEAFVKQVTGHQGDSAEHTLNALAADLPRQNVTH